MPDHNHYAHLNMFHRSSEPVVLRKGDYEPNLEVRYDMKLYTSYFGSGAYRFTVVYKIHQEGVIVVYAQKVSDVTKKDATQATIDELASLIHDYGASLRAELQIFIPTNFSGMYLQILPLSDEELTIMASKIH